MAASRPVSAVERLICEKVVLFVSGKGGSGKTTVATALGVAAARRGRRTIVCDLAGVGTVARAFGITARTGVEIRLRQNLWSLSLDAKSALREWLRRQPGGRVADAALSHSPAFAHFVAAAPGAKELIAIGKVLDLAGRGPDRARAAPYELVVVDAPSTGHALGMIETPGAVSQATARGPVAAQAQALRRVLADPLATGYVGASLPEEMSVHEVLALERGLHNAIGRGLDVIVVNGIYPDRFTDEEAGRLQQLATEVEWHEALRAALSAHRRARRHAAYVRRLRAQAHAPVVTLPCVFAGTLGPAEYEALADELTTPVPVASGAGTHCMVRAIDR
jgi:anion-transporting  ArsA/GET3 family ATPase